MKNPGKEAGLSGDDDPGFEMAMTLLFLALIAVMLVMLLKGEW